jgi:tetrapyrrole methylase family protein/MazG family protein
MPVLLIGIDSKELALHLKDVLLAVYPEEHEVFVVNGGKKKEERLGEFSVEDFSESTCFYLPALEEGTSFESFAEIIAHLRAPDGCPWDREQTHKSLRTHLLEESYEALSAIDAGDFDSMREEFGDLLLQIVLNAQIASEEKKFTITEVIKSIYDKIIRRHPHVFGDVKLDGVGGVLQNWEKLKEQEREKLALSNAEGKKEGKGLLDGVPAALPALIQAQEYQDRAARVGFDWPEIEGVLDKVREEIDEIERAENLEEVTAELGDLFFALVNLARWRKVDAESALRETNLKFKRRFAYVEGGIKNQGRNLSDTSLEEMDALWNKAKQMGL